MNSINGICSLKAEESHMYSASVIERAVSPCNLEAQGIGHPVYVITHLDHDGSLQTPSSFQFPVKSASTQKSKLFDSSGLNIIPLSQVPMRY